MQLISGIYQIKNTINNKIYIGSAKNIRIRKNKHFSDLLKNKHHCIKLQNSFNKHGVNNFEFSLLANCPEEYLIKLEQWFLDNLQPEYNIYKTAYSPLGHKMSEESKLKLSNIKKGIPKPKGFGEKLAEINRGKKFSKEHKEKLRIAYSKRKIKGSPKLTEKQVLEIKKLLSDNRTGIYIANLYGIRTSTVSNIKNNKSWNNLKIEDYGL